MWYSAACLMVLGVSVVCLYDTQRERSTAPFGVPVFLNVYHVSKLDSVKGVNAVFAPRFSPLKLGGIFHVGVEVGGVELSYGETASESGVSEGIPRSDSQHCFRQTIHQGITPLRADDIKELLRIISDEWRGD